MIISGSEDFWPLSGPRDKRRAPLANVIEDGPNGHLAVDQAHGRGECVARLAY